MFVQALSKVARRIRGWGEAFKDANQRVEFIQLDRQLHELVRTFRNGILRAREPLIQSAQ